MVDWDKLIDKIRKIFRAKQGLPLEDDFFQGLIHTSDDRERTKLTRHDVFRHAYMDLIASIGGEEWGIMGKLAQEERALFISEDGERAAAFINSIARKQQEPAPITNITMQNQPQPQQPEKKGFLRR